MMRLRRNRMFVQLSSCIDESRLDQISNNAKFDEFSKPDGTAFVEINSLKEASLLCRKFINRFNLGSSNWMGGLVVDENYNFIARVSFNGRVWDNEDWKNCKEIAL